MHRIFSELYYAFVEDIDIEGEKSACDILCVVGKMCCESYIHGMLIQHVVLYIVCVCLTLH